MARTTQEGGALQFVTRKGKKLGLDAVKQAIDQEIRSSIGYVGGETSEDRRRAMEYYLAEPFGNEVEGRSQVVSSDVQDVIESMMPEFMEIFAGTDQIVRFKPRGPEDEETAQQATEYVNYVWMQDNDGYGCIHDWIKDALLQKNGIMKIWWEETDHFDREILENVNSLGLEALMQDPDVEILEITEKPVNDPVVIQFAPDGIVYDVTLVRRESKGQIKIYCLPPEEFLISRRSIDLDDASFTCHKVKKTVSELIEEGYDEKELEGVPSHDTQDFNEERVARFPEDDEWPDWENNLDPTMREIWLYESYIKLDYDGDGIAEMNQCITAGRGHYLLTNPKSGEKVTPVDNHPFSALTPIRMPHKFFGRSMADLTMDIQLIKSTFERQWLDNIYNINNNRAAINERVDLDSYLNNVPGQPIIIEDDRPVGDAIAQIDTTPLHGYVLPVLEYFDTSREERTGSTRLDQGLDPESLNKTARGMNLMLGRTMKRKLMMARLFAETGFKCAMRKTLKLLVQHQPRARVIRLRNQWVEVDPRGWDSSMDVEINVGLGYGTNQEKLQFLGNIQNVQQAIAQFQGGLNGPLVTWQNVWESSREVVSAAGFPSAEPFFTQPDPNFQPPPDPATVEAEGKTRIEEQKLQVEAQKDQGRLQLQAKEHEDKMELRRWEVQNEIAIKREVAGLTAQTEREKLATNAQVEREKAATNAQVQREKASLDAQTKRETAKDGGVSLNVQGSEDTVANVSRSMEAQSESLTGIAEFLAQAVQAMSQASSQIATAAEAMAAPKTVVRDEKGKVVGVRPA